MKKEEKKLLKAKKRKYEQSNHCSTASRYFGD